MDRECAAEYETRHCFVLCRAAQPADLSRASKFVVEVFGPGYSADVDDGELITVMHGKDVIGYLGYMPVPIPQQEAERNADRNVFWPNGKDEAAKHRSHVVVTNIGAGDQTPVQSAITVSRLALVALKAFDGIGVYWGNGSVCNSREVFERFCENLSEKHLPVPMWIRLQLIRAPNEEVGLYTLGMSQFGLMEIEVDRCKMEAQELIEWVSDLAHYLIQSGPIVKDEDTVGASENERILVRYRPSMTNEDRQVYKVVFEGE